MPRIAEQAGPVTGGVDTHADVHVAAVVDRVGRVLGTQAFPATAAGYRAALAWMSAHGELAKVGVEGTGSYGAGLARYLAGCGVEVAEVIRPNRQARRQRGKSDAADAVAAAVAALSGEASGRPKSRDGAAESIRALKVARAGAVKARTQAGNQLRDLILTAPEPLRQQLAGLPSGRQAEVAARFRPGDPACPAEGAKAAMASLARRHQQLAAEITRLDAMLDELVRHAAPAQFLAKRGVATQVTATLLVTTGDNPGRIRKEASFAALCGASPVDASSGKQLRHRLNRGGDRQANSALWTIAMTRLGLRPADQGLRRPAHRRGQDQERDHSLPQALHRPRDLQGPVPPPTTRNATRATCQTRSFSSDLDAGASAGPGADCRGQSATLCYQRLTARACRPPASSFHHAGILQRGYEGYPQRRCRKAGSAG
jgi:transposase